MKITEETTPEEFNKIVTKCIEEIGDIAIKNIESLDCNKTVKYILWARVINYIFAENFKMSFNVSNKLINMARGDLNEH